MMIVAELADQIRSAAAGAPLIVSECPSHTPRDKAAETQIELLRIREWWGVSDGFDDSLDRTWLAEVTPRVAEVLGVAWSVIDYSAKPPEIFGSSSAATESVSRNT